MKELSLYKTNNGDYYVCIYVEVEECIKVLGPFPKILEIATKPGVVFEVQARSDAEALINLAMEVGAGTISYTAPPEVDDVFAEASKIQ